MNEQSNHSKSRTTVGLIAFFAFLLTTATAIATPMPRPPRATAPAPSEARPRARAASSVTGVININKATASQLQLLPGVGETKARRIIAWRNQHGPFERVKDLRRVKGFGKKTVAKLAPYLRLSGATSLAKGK